MLFQCKNMFSSFAYYCSRSTCRFLTLFVVVVACTFPTPTHAQSWVPFSPLDTKVGFGAAVECGGTTIVIGGSTSAWNSTPTPTSAVQRFSPPWVRLPDLPVPLMGAGLAACLGLATIAVFPAGSMLPNPNGTAAVYVLHTGHTSPQWMEVELHGAAPLHRYGASVAQIGDIVYVMGGTDGHKLFDVVESFTFNSNHTSGNVIKMEVSPWGTVFAKINAAACAVAQSTILLIGGHDLNGNWSKIVMTFAPSPKNATSGGMYSMESTVPDVIQNPNCASIASSVWIFSNNHRVMSSPVLYLLDSISQTFVQWANTQRMNPVRFGGAFLSVTKELHVLGGYDVSTFTPSAECEYLVTPLADPTWSVGEETITLGDAFSFAFVGVSPTKSSVVKLCDNPFCDDYIEPPVQLQYNLTIRPRSTFTHAWVCFSSGQCVNMVDPCPTTLPTGMDPRLACVSVGCCIGIQGGCYAASPITPDTIGYAGWVLTQNTVLTVLPTTAPTLPPTSTPTPAPTNHTTLPPQPPPWPTPTMPPTPTPTPSGTPLPANPNDVSIPKDWLIGGAVLMVCVALAIVSFVLGRQYFSAKRRRGYQTLGTTYGKYEIVRKLGAGGYGHVYLVRRGDGREYAMKFIGCGGDDERSNAISEFEVLRRLQGHPNMIRLVDMFMNWKELMDVGDEDSTTSRELSSADEALLRYDAMPRYVCLIMEYLPEGTLRKFLLDLEEPLPEHQVASFTMQLCELLKYLHGQKPPVLHRDIKPDNILMANNGQRLVVTDFGLAKDTAEQTYLTTQAGSLPFVAPECWQRHYSTKVDIWAAGCIVYALCTRRVTPHNTRVMFSEASRPGFEDELRDEILAVYSPQMVRLVLWLLQPDPKDRPSAADVIEFLKINFGV
eukprot:PhM_4_TR2841/c0_g1_i2/m.36965